MTARASKSNAKVDKNFQYTKYYPEKRILKFVARPLIRGYDAIFSLIGSASLQFPVGQ
jgi:hypothetical protein